MLAPVIDVAGLEDGLAHPPQHPALVAGIDPPVEVVGHLRFQLEVTIGVEIEVGADAEGIQVVEIRESEIVRLHPEFAVAIRAALIVALRNRAGSGVVLRGRRTRRRGALRSRARRGGRSGGRLLRLVAGSGRLTTASGRASGGRRAAGRSRCCGRRALGRALAATRLSGVLR